MSVDKSFLQDEVRNGFYIPASVKQCFAVELDILAAIDSLCQKYNIKYYAEYGTLLGAVRHGGFIPWDDDLDIGMFRTDLDKFLAVASELPEGYAIHSYKNRPDYTQFIYNVVNTTHINLDPKFLKNNHGMPYICGVDIFVMDNVSDNEDEEMERCNLANYVIQIADEIFSGNITTSESIKIIKKIEKRTGDTVNSSLYSMSTANNVDLRIRLYEIGEKLFTLFNDRVTSEICQIMPWGLNGVRHYPREYYEELVRLPFENTTIPVPARYNSMLLNRYGDYMRLVKTQDTHNYPCFAIQRDNLKNQIVENMGLDTYNSVFSIYDLKAAQDALSIDNTNGADGKEPQTVVFLPFDGRYWNVFANEYEKALNTPNTDIYVVPIPYFYRDFATKELSDGQLNIELYPEDITLYDWTDFDIEALHPNKIYIQYPYDNYNPVTGIHPDFYSSVLKESTDELIYIPWCRVDDFSRNEERSYTNLDSYCLTPAVINADRIILPSESCKNVYIEKLCEWTGEAYRSVWDKKIEYIPALEVKSSEITTSDNSKKCIMYYIGLGQTIEGGAQYIEKIEKTFSIIRKHNRDINLYIKVDSTFESSLHSLYPELYNQFINIINPVMEDPDWIYDNSEYIDYAIDYCDAFYGDAGYVANLFRAVNKPVMIQNIEV